LPTHERVSHLWTDSRRLLPGIVPLASFLKPSRPIRLISKQTEFRVMKTLIVDDEPIARRVLREELELFPEVVIVGKAGDGKEALQRTEKLRRDGVFLELQMPVMRCLGALAGSSRLPANCRFRIKASAKTIRQSLEGNWRRRSCLAPMAAIHPGTNPSPRRPTAISRGRQFQR
jgi:CheY-like chemotaxis protein